MGDASRGSRRQTSRTTHRVLLMPTDLPAIRRTAVPPASWPYALVMLAMAVGATVLLVSLPMPEARDGAPTIVLAGP